MVQLFSTVQELAPAHLKATFFAVFASFTNLALSASNLLTKYLNQIFVVTREVKDKLNNDILTNANYDELGVLIFIIVLLTFFMPYLTIILIQKTKFQTNE